MNKILLLAYDYPPYNSVGSLRPSSWAKYLSENNFQVTVISRNWSKIDFNDEHFYIRENKSLEVDNDNNLTIIKTPFIPSLSNKIALKYGNKRFKVIRKIITSIYNFIELYVIIGSKKSVYQYSKNQLEKKKFDLIIATGEPFTLFYYAYKLSKKYNVPWVADYRDLWTETRYKWNPFVGFIIRLREKKIIRSTSFVVTVSENLKKVISKKCKNEILIVRNGFDEVDFKINNQNENKLIISFAGTLYKWHPVKSILKTIRNLKSDIIQLEFYGLNNEAYLKQIIENEFPSLIEQVVFHKRLPVRDLLCELSKTHFLLLFNDYSMLGTKIFNYLRTNRNILFCYTNDKSSNELKNNYFPNKTFLSSTHNLQEELLLELDYGICIKEEQELFHILQRNLYYFINNGKVIDYTSRKDISHLSRTQQNLILKNKLMSLNCKK